MPGIVNVESLLDPAYVTGPSGEDWTVRYLLSRRNVQLGWESLNPKGYLRRGPSLVTAGIKLPRGGRRQNSLIGGGIQNTGKLCPLSGPDSQMKPSLEWRNVTGLPGGQLETVFRVSHGL